MPKPSSPTPREDVPRRPSDMGQAAEGEVSASSDDDSDDYEPSTGGSEYSAGPHPHAHARGSLYDSCEGRDGEEDRGSPRPAARTGSALSSSHSESSSCPPTDESDLEIDLYSQPQTPVTGRAASRTLSGPGAFNRVLSGSYRGEGAAAGGADPNEKWRRTCSGSWRKHTQGLEPSSGLERWFSSSEEEITDMSDAESDVVRLGRASGASTPGGGGGGRP